MSFEVEELNIRVESEKHVEIQIHPLESKPVSVPRGSHNWLNQIAVNGPYAIVFVTLLLVCGVSRVGLGVKLGGHRWHEGFGIVIISLMLLSIYWTVHYLQKSHPPDLGRETNGDQAMSICARPDKPHEDVPGDGDGHGREMAQVNGAEILSKEQDEQFHAEERVAMSPGRETNGEILLTEQVQQSLGRGTKWDQPMPIHERSDEAHENVLGDGDGDGHGVTTLPVNGVEILSTEHDQQLNAEEVAILSIGRETTGDQAMSICARPDEPHEDVLGDGDGHGWTTAQVNGVEILSSEQDEQFKYAEVRVAMSLGRETNGEILLTEQDQQSLGRGTNRHQPMPIHERPAERHKYGHGVICFFVNVMVVMFTVPLIRTLKKKQGAVGEDLGLWNVLNPTLHTVEVVVGMVKLIEFAVGIWLVVVLEALSLVSRYVSLSRRGLSGDNRMGQSLNLLMLQKMMQFLLVPVLTILTVILAAVVFTSNMPFSVAQLLWAQVVVTLGEIALAKEAAAAQVRTQRCSGRDNMNDNIAGDDPVLIFNTTWRNLVVRWFYQTVVLLGLHFGGTHLPLKLGDVEINQTVKFNVLLLCIIFSLVSARRTEEWNILEGVLSNRFLVGVVVFAVVLQVLLVEFGGSFTSTVKLNWRQWMLCTGVAIISWLLDWLFKRLCPPIPDDLRFRPV